MLHKSAILAIAAIGLSAGVPAEAAKILFAGQGVVETLRGSLPTSGTASNGSVFQFAFTIDTHALSFLEGDDQNAFYDLPVTDFTATIGSYAFALSAEPGFEPVLAIGRGFTFLDTPVSEPVLVTSFYFASARSTGAADSAPFVTGSGAYGTLVIDALFRAQSGETGLGLNKLRNPRDADRLSFSYTTRDPSTRRNGTILGAYQGGFSTAAVPEPSTWTLMFIGFAMIGAGLRARHGTVRDGSTELHGI